LGVLIISTQGNITALQFTNLTGDILAVGSSIIWALYWILNLKDEREPVVKLFWNFVFGSIYITIAVIFLSEFPTSLSLSFGAAVYTGLFEMGLAFVLWLNALRLSRDSASVGIFAYMTPFLSLIFISIVLGEKILPSSVVGLIFIIGGIVVQAFMGGRKVA
jgi:drug/metabolite transporter (DMT)-like permease